MSTTNIILFISVCLYISLSNKNDVYSAEELGFKLVGDSGYILKKDAKKFLEKDTFYQWGENVDTDNDTIGKYYKVARTGNYFVCIKSYLTDGLADYIMEVLPTRMVVKKERYYYGMYRCCWNNKEDGFQKYGDWFSYKTCGTGSGFCSAFHYFFKDIKPADSIQTIWGNSSVHFVL